MSVRSSMQLTSVCVLSVCAFMGACAHAPGSARLRASEMPELGEPMPPPKSPAKSTAPVLVLARLDLDTPVSRLCADPRAKAVLDSDLPGLTTRPEFPFFKNMSLNKLKKMSRGQMSDADLAKVRIGLARLDEGPEDGER